MNGARDVGGLINWANDELGLTPTAAELQSVISTLGDLGYLMDLAGVPEVATSSSAASESPVPVPIAPAAPRVETPPPTSKGSNVELGSAGFAARVPTPQPEVPKADNFELGMPGESPMTQPRPEPPKADDVELGFAGMEDVPVADEGPIVASAEIEVAPLSADTSYSYTSQKKAEAEESFADLNDERAPTQSTAPLTVDGEDIELGSLTPPPTDMPIEQPKATLRPVTNPRMDEEDEPTHLPPPQVEYDDDDVSVDLSAHLSLGTDELKEAVRQSKVMQAVEIPADLMAELDDEKPTSVAVKPAPEPATPEPVAPVAPPPVAKPAIGKSPATAKAKPKSVPPVELPVDKSKADAKADDTAEKKPKKTSTGLIVFFVIVLLGAGFAYWWTQMRNTDSPKRKRTRTTKPTKPTNVKPTGTKPTGPTGTKPTDPTNVKPTDPTGTKPTDPTGTKPTDPTGTKPTGTKPAAVSFKLAASAGAGTAVNMPEGSMPNFVVDDGAKVNAGDVVAKVGPWRRLEPQVTHELSRITHYETKVKAIEKKAADARAAGDEAGAARFDKDAKDMRKRKLEVRQKKIDKWKARIELKAPKAGTVRYVAGKNKWVNQGKPVFKIETGTGVSGSFTAAEGKTYKNGDDVAVSVKGDAKKTGNCKVTGVDAKTITVDCSSTGFAAGDELSLQ